MLQKNGIDGHHTAMFNQMAEILKDIQLLCIEKHVENKKEYVVNLKWKFLPHRKKTHTKIWLLIIYLFS